MLGIPVPAPPPTSPRLGQGVDPEHPQGSGSPRDKVPVDRKGKRSTTRGRGRGRSYLQGEQDKVLSTDIGSGHSPPWACSRPSAGSVSRPRSPPQSSHLCTVLLSPQSMSSGLGQGWSELKENHPIHKYSELRTSSACWLSDHWASLAQEMATEWLTGESLP